MIEGHLDVVWENRLARGEPDGTYRVLFCPTSQDLASHGAVRQQCSIHGEEALRGLFLTDLLNRNMTLERRQSIVDEWLDKLRENGLLTLRPVEITKELFDKLTVK